MEYAPANLDETGPWFDVGSRVKSITYFKVGFTGTVIDARWSEEKNEYEYQVKWDDALWRPSWMYESELESA